MFNEIVKNAEAVLRRSAGEEKRRQAWLAHDEDEEEPDAAAAADEAGVAAPGSRKDVFDCDMDRFCPPGGTRSRPPHWKDLQQQQQTTATWQTTAIAAAGISTSTALAEATAMQQRQHTAQDAVKIASWIQVDEMRTLLEIHYDQAFFCFLSSSSSFTFALPLSVRPHLRNRTYVTKKIRCTYSATSRLANRVRSVGPASTSCSTPWRSRIE